MNGTSHDDWRGRTEDGPDGDYFGESPPPPSPEAMEGYRRAAVELLEQLKREERVR